MPTQLENVFDFARDYVTRKIKQKQHDVLEKSVICGFCYFPAKDEKGNYVILAIE